MDEEYEEYFEHFTKAISKETKDYATNEVFKSKRYIFTRREGRQQYGYCTHCKTELKSESLKHNKKAECPRCKSVCTIKSSGMGRSTMIDEAYFVYYQKSLKDPNVITAKGIYAVRDYRYDYHNVKTKYGETALYIFRLGASVMLQREFYYSGAKDINLYSYGKTGKIYSEYYRGSLANINTACQCSEKSIEDAVKDTPFQYCGYKDYRRYINDDIVEYFDLYTKYPKIEYLTKTGLNELVRDKLLGFKTYSALNWRGNTLFKMLKINKGDLKEIKTKKIEITFLFLKYFQIAKKDGSKLSLEQISEFSKHYIGNYNKIYGILKYTSLKKAIRYIEKQTEERSKEILSHYVSDTVITWRDYIDDCIKLGMDLSSENVILPRDLYTSHENTIKQIKLKADETLNLKMKERKKLLERYRFQYNGLMIRAAESSDELIAEGAALSHCVGMYAGRHASGETNILFIRKASELDKPYYTVEVKNNIIIQVHGKNNRSANEEVANFVNAFKNEKLEKKTKENRVRLTA